MKFIQYSRSVNVVSSSFDVTNQVSRTSACREYALRWHTRTDTTFQDMHEQIIIGTVALFTVISCYVWKEIRRLIHTTGTM